MSGFGKIVIAVDKFKGSMTAVQASEAVRDGIMEGCREAGNASPEIILRPMADGGEGSMGVMERALRESGRSYRKEFIPTVNHLGSQILAPVLLYSAENGTRCAFVEMASVCGLNMIPRDRRNLLRSTTYGLGIVLRECIGSHGVREILMAIGGSGTNDGGFGLLFTLPGMVIGQTILALPIIISWTAQSVESLDPRCRETLLTLGAGPVQLAWLSIRELRYEIGMTCVTAFGRVVTEVGVAMMLGGNIRYSTRTMTTAISLETSKGEFAQGIALGLVLLLIAFIVNFLLAWLKQRGRA